ncbi:MAG: DUF1353 domain-containing protein [Alphaproteobacteria bacterium]|nr:DUF1353 domain-containing protein [Alphaproteobacteria bacterium]
MGNPFVEVEYSDHVLLARFKEGDPHGDGDNYVVLRDYTVRYRRADDPDKWHKVTVPAGFLTDLASVPWFARWLVSKTGHHTEAAVVHDYCYAYQPGDRRPHSGLSRQDADYLFAALMQRALVIPLVNWAAHAAVASFGGDPYENRFEIRNVREPIKGEERLERSRRILYRQWAELMDQLGGEWLKLKEETPPFDPHARMEKAKKAALKKKAEAEEDPDWFVGAVR